VALIQASQMNETELLDSIEDMSPQAQCLLLIVIGNHLREAVDDGRANIMLLQQAADHLTMLLEHGPQVHGKQ
jgi:hypothetical protein